MSDNRFNQPCNYLNGVIIFDAMKKLLPLLVFFYSVNFISAQTFQVFKGDTINRIDNKGLKQGVWKKYYSNDTLFSEGVYKNGAHTGIFRTYHRNGKLQSVLKFKGTTETCNAELYYEDGKMMSRGKYINHTKDSAWVYFDLEGNKNAEEFYNNGVREGTWKTFYQNGKPSQILVYKKDKKNGPYKEFFDSGNPKIEATMVDDEFVGVVTIYHPNKNVWQKGSYVKGVKEGKWIVNKEDGTLEREEIYVGGELTNPVEH